MFDEIIFADSVDSDEVDNYRDFWHEPWGWFNDSVTAQ